MQFSGSRDEDAITNSLFRKQLCCSDTPPTIFVHLLCLFSLSFLPIADWLKDLHLHVKRENVGQIFTAVFFPNLLYHVWNLRGNFKKNASFCRF